MLYQENSAKIFTECLLKNPTLSFKRQRIEMYTLRNWLLLVDIGKQEFLIRRHQYTRSKLRQIELA